MRTVFRLALALAAAAAAHAAIAKLPPLSDEAKAKAAEAAAKTAWSDKLANFQLCKAQDRAAASHQAAMKLAGKEAKPATSTPPCADPGPYVPAVAAAPSGAAPAPSTAAAAAPAAPASANKS